MWERSPIDDMREDKAPFYSFPPYVVWDNRQNVNFTRSNTHNIVSQLERGWRGGRRGYLGAGAWGRRVGLLAAGRWAAWRIAEGMGDVINRGNSMMALLSSFLYTPILCCWFMHTSMLFDTLPPWFAHKKWSEGEELGWIPTRAFFWPVFFKFSGPSF